MGDLFSLCCQDCGYSVELMLGVGMMFTTPENLPRMVSKSRREKVQELLKREDLTRVQYSYDLFFCPKCNLQASRLNFQIEFGEGEVYQPYFLCSRCRTRLVIDTNPHQRRPCPYCGSEDVYYNIGEWD
ncbi:MAG: hypothetical protein WBB69_06790 [Anaerolineales bacterium]